MEGAGCVDRSPTLHADDAVIHEGEERPEAAALAKEGWRKLEHEADAVCERGERGRGPRPSIQAMRLEDECAMQHLLSAARTLSRPPRRLRYSTARPWNSLSRGFYDATRPGDSGVLRNPD